MKRALTLCLLGLSTGIASALPSKDYFAAAYVNYNDEGQKLLDGLDIKTGHIELDHGVVLNLPENFYFLDKQDATEVLEQIWGNPVGSSIDTLGMIFPKRSTPLDENSWGIDLTFEEIGFISDTDAASMNFDDMLQSMREDTAAANESRIKDGYQPITLIGWASQPKYDAANKRLHWAKELKFGENTENTLNYNVRFLGRKGVFQMNYIAGMPQLAEINQNIEPVLNLASFKEGSRYSDFNPDVDTVAAIGIGGLIAGKAAAKFGLLAAALIFLKKAWFLLLVPIVWLRNKFRSDPPGA